MTSPGDAPGDATSDMVRRRQRAACAKINSASIRRDCSRQGALISTHVMLASGTGIEASGFRYRTRIPGLDPAMTVSRLNRDQGAPVLAGRKP
jgi:hypothetical protein